MTWALKLSPSWFLDNSGNFEAHDSYNHINRILEKKYCVYLIIHFSHTDLSPLVISRDPKEYGNWRWIDRSFSFWYLWQNSSRLCKIERSPNEICENDLQSSKWFSLLNSFIDWRRGFSFRKEQKYADCKLELMLYFTFTWNRLTIFF